MFFTILVMFDGCSCLQEISTDDRIVTSADEVGNGKSSPKNADPVGPSGDPNEIRNISHLSPVLGVSSIMVSDP
jgi:hypothetical protein